MILVAAALAVAMPMVVFVGWAFGHGGPVLRLSRGRAPRPTSGAPEAWAGEPAPLAELLASLGLRRPHPAEAGRTPPPGAGKRRVSDGPGPRHADREGGSLRRHRRIKPQRTSVTVLTEEGHSLAARILDLSRSGVALEGTMTGVWVGAMVTVGGRRAKAVRMLPGGMALEFSIPIPAEDFDDGAVL